MAEEQLSGRDLDPAVAERVMGCKLRVNALPSGVATYYYCECGHGEHGDHDNEELRVDTDPWEIARYSESIEAAMQVEDRIAEMGLKKIYFTCLLQEVCDSLANYSASMFDVVHATAKQRCRAALKAVEQGKVSSHET